jgi:hypothetical protein
MTYSWRSSRRALLRSWLVSLLGKTAARGISAPASVFQRRYRVDATILLLGAPLFTRQGVGGGDASVEIDSSAVSLQFAAGTLPARAHGLNRFGILHEAVTLRGRDPAPTTDPSFAGLSFAGLMTRSREESFEQGRRALGSNSHGGEAVITRGRATGSEIQTWTENIELAPDCNWSNVNDTLREALRHEPPAPPRTSAAGSATTFLHAMRGVALCPEAEVRRKFVHAGNFYWLETRRHPQRGSQLDGAIYNLDGARRAEFRNTYAAGDESGIPIRIEYRPRSFLRLTFEAELSATGPNIPSFRSEENT